MSRLDNRVHAYLYEGVWMYDVYVEGRLRGGFTTMRAAIDWLKILTSNKQG